MSARFVLVAGCAAGWALWGAAPAAAACTGWQVDRELSLRHAAGWTMIQVRQDGDRISGTARRTGLVGSGGAAQGGGSVQGRLQPQRIWIKIMWPGGSEIFDGTISPDGDASGTRISEDGRQDGTAWEAIEPLACRSSGSVSQAAGGGSAGSSTGVDEFSRAVRDIIGVLRGDDEPGSAQSGNAPSGSSASTSATSAGSDPFQAPSGSSASDPFQQAPADGSSGGSAQSAGERSGQSDGGWSDFDPSQMDSAPASDPPVSPMPPGGPARQLPSSAYEEPGIGSVKPGSSSTPATGASMPIMIVPIGKLSDNCASGFVWREARPSDHVCVTPAARDRVKGENHFARNYRDTEGVYGCKAGYVWREAYSGDRTCVGPAARDLAAEENRLGPQRKAAK